MDTTTHAEQYGPDQAIYRHWLDRDAKAVIGAASVLATFRKKYGQPARINRGNGYTAYSWLSGFDLQTVTIFR